MPYTYVKSRPLNDRECRRLRLSARLARQVRELEADAAGCPLAAPVEPRTRPGSARFQRSLRELFFASASSAPRVSAPVLDWALCYARPRLLTRLFAAARDDGGVSPVLAALARTEPGLLLSREYITPDYQEFRRHGDGPGRVLVCFTGNAHRLNVPVQLFHCLAVGLFDQLIYLRDDRKQHYTNGVAAFAETPAELVAALGARIAAGARLAIVATSSGGLAATAVAESLGADRVALFSPAFRYKEHTAAATAGRLDPMRVRLYVANGSAMDADLLDDWTQTALSSAIHRLDSASHGTLSFLLRQDLGAELLHWLADVPTK